MGPMQGLMHVPLYNFFLKKMGTESHLTQQRERRKEFSMTPKKEMDRVCGMWIETEGTRFISVYRGETYYFCAEECKNKFDQNPVYYMVGVEGRKP